MADSAPASLAETGAASLTWGAADPVDYLALLKPSVMSLVVFTALAGLVAAPGQIHPVIGFAAILCIALGAGASGALNMWYDADIDRLMARTRVRPIPAGRVSPGEALGFGVGLSVASVVAMGLWVNLVAAGLLAFTIFFYAVIYTMGLKRRTPQNIVIGGAAGAFPPMIAWAAVTGGVSWESAVLFAIIFMWTPPHFWALALKKSDEYRKAGIPMLPVVAGERVTRLNILVYSVLLVPVSLLPLVLQFAGAIYGVTAALGGVCFVALAWQVWRGSDLKQPMRLFGYSILYLFALFGALMIDHLVAGWA